MQEDLHMAPDFRSCSACGELHDTYDSKRDHYLLPVRDAQGNETTIGTAPVCPHQGECPVCMLMEEHFLYISHHARNCPLLSGRVSSAEGDTVHFRSPDGTLLRLEHNVDLLGKAWQGVLDLGTMGGELETLQDANDVLLLAETLLLGGVPGQALAFLRVLSKWMHEQMDDHVDFSSWSLTPDGDGEHPLVQLVRLEAWALSRVQPVSVQVSFAQHFFFPFWRDVVRLLPREVVEEIEEQCLETRRELVDGFVQRGDVEGVLEDVELQGLPDAESVREMGFTAQTDLLLIVRTLFHLAEQNEWFVVFWFFFSPGISFYLSSILSWAPFRFPGTMRSCTCTFWRQRRWSATVSTWKARS